MTGKDIFKVTLNLVIVYLVGGFILAFVYANASPKIFRNNEEAEKKALKELVPDADATEKHDWTIHDKHAKYFIMKKGGDTIGYVRWKLHRVNSSNLGRGDSSRRRTGVQAGARPSSYSGRSGPAPR